MVPLVPLKEIKFSLIWNVFIETYLLDFLKFALRGNILTSVDVCWALVLEAHAEVMAAHGGRKQPDLSVSGAFHGPPLSLASKTASLVMGSSRQVLKRLWAHFIGCRNATDGGGSQQTHKVAREESHELIAQNTAGCENGLYKVKKKKKKICHFQETIQRWVPGEYLAPG